MFHSTLHDAHQDIHSQPWATPAGHQAMDGYFKLLCAEEEITQLNIEIHWFLTFMHNEDATLCARQKEVGLVDPAIAYQICIQHINFNRFTPRHMKNLIKISQLPGFSGNMSHRVHITELQLPPLPPPSSVEIAGIRRWEQLSYNHLNQLHGSGVVLITIHLLLLVSLWPLRDFRCIQSTKVY